jgi:ribose transport system permease protein
VVRVGPLLVLVLAALVMTILSPAFLSGGNLKNIGIQAAIVGTLAIGQLLVILTQGIDLSVGSVVALSGVVGVEVALSGASPVVVILVMIAVGAGVGVANGVTLVAGRAANAIVVTLATLGIARGLALIISDGESRFGLPNTIFQIGSGSVGAIPVPLIIALGLALLGIVFTQYTQWGTWIYAVGADREAARRAGIPDGRVLISVYVLCGLTAGIAGMMVAGQSGVAAPTAGMLLELDAITAVIIGGASFLGGRGTVGNVVIGACILAVIRNGLNILSVDPFVQQVAIGVLILIAIQLDSLRAHLEGRFRTAQALHVE